MKLIQKLKRWVRHLIPVRFTFIDWREIDVDGPKTQTFFLFPWDSVAISDQEGDRLLFKYAAPFAFTLEILREGNAQGSNEVEKASEARETERES